MFQWINIFLVLITVYSDIVYNYLELVLLNFSIIKCFYRPIILPEGDDTNDTTVDVDDSEVTLEKIEEEMIAVMKNALLSQLLDSNWYASNGLINFYFYNF